MARGKRAREDPRKYRVKLWDSGDEETSSEEDFHYLTKQLNEKDKGGELDKTTKKLLRGVVQESYKARKHPERYYRAGHTESSDDASGVKEEEDNFDLGNATRMNMIMPGKQYNISEEDWNKLSREEQLRRMNEVANEFNFYAKDKPDQELTDLGMSGGKGNIQLQRAAEGGKKGSWCFLL